MESLRQLEMGAASPDDPASWSWARTGQHIERCNGNLQVDTPQESHLEVGTGDTG